MQRLRMGALVLAVGLTPALLVGQRGPEPQQGTGQNNPDMEHGNAPGGKSDQPNDSGTAAPQSPGQESPDTQQTKPSTKKGKKKNHKEHGGSHDQASPQI